MKKWFTMLMVLTLAASLLAGMAVTAYASDADADEAEEEENAPAEEAEEIMEPAEETEEITEEDLEGLDRIGEETEDGYKIKLVNATGSDIMGMNIQKTTDDSWVWSDELLADGDKFEADETAVFCYTPGEDEDEKTLYNVQIVFTNWTVGYLHMVALSDMNAAELQRAVNSLPYLVYTSLSSKEEINTYEAEQKAFEGELAAGVWDAVLYGNSSSSSSSGSSSSGSSSSGSSYSGSSSSSSGSSEGCIGSSGLLY